MQSQQPEMLYRLPTVLEIVGMGKTKWYDGIKKGIHPRPIVRSRRDVVWLSSDIQGYVNEVRNLSR